MKKIFLILSFFTILISLTLASCKKDSGPPKPQGSFVITGTLLRNGDSTIMQNTKVKVDYDVPYNLLTGGGGTAQLSGTATSDTNGYFRMDCIWYGASGYYQFDDFYSIYPQKDTIMDLGNVYLNY